MENKKIFIKEDMVKEEDCEIDFSSDLFKTSITFKEEILKRLEERVIWEVENNNDKIDIKKVKKIYELIEWFKEKK